MRWQASLQLAVGLGALFGLAYLGVEKFLGPPLEAKEIEAARAHAVVGAAEVASAWERIRSGRRALVRALAASPTFREGSSEQIRAALESAAVQAGNGSAALFQSNGELIASHGDAGERLKQAAAIGDAREGVAIVRLEKIGDELFAVSAAPSEDGRVLVLASKIDETELRLWTRELPDSISVAIVDGDRMLSNTAIPSVSKQLAPPFAEEMRVGDRRLRTARRSISDDGGARLSVYGMASIEPIAGSEVVDRARLLVLALGGFALLLAVVVVMLAPTGSVKELIEEFNQASRDLPVVPEAKPIEQIELSPEPALEALPAPFFAPTPPPPSRSRDRMPESPPLVPPAPSFSSPGLDPIAQPQKRDRPSSDTRLALDAEQAIKPISKPSTLPPPASSRSNPNLGFGPSDAIPLPGSSPSSMRQGSMPPPSSPFDQIAAAAFAPPPVLPTPAPSPSLSRGPKEDDLLMPKGVDLDAIAREAAKQGPPKFEPSDLPGLRSPFGTPAPSISSGLPASRSQRPEDLPGLRANDPAARAFDRSPPAPPAGRRTSDPWSNPAVGMYSTTPPVAERLVVPERIPSNPPAPSRPAAPASTGPVAYDEEHYRVVYNDFVASKARLGEQVDNITYEGFRSKLRSSEEALINRHGCRAVRFQVLVKDNTVSLRPQLVR